MEMIGGEGGERQDGSCDVEPELEELRKELKERQTELDHVNKEHEDEELKLKHEREKLVVRIEKSDSNSTRGSAMRSGARLLSE